MNAFGMAGAGVNDFMGIVSGIQGMLDADEAERLAQMGRSQFDLSRITPDQLRIAAEQMGLPPEVLASKIRGDQMNALRQMQNIASQGGLDDAAIAANRQSQADAAQQLQQSNAAISSNLARQGVNPGSGAEIAMRQNIAQSSANRLSSEGIKNAANAQMRALQAINESGRIAGDIASADEQRAQANRAAAFERDRYNTGVRNAANQFNSQSIIDAKNANNAGASAFGNYGLGAADRTLEASRHRGRSSDKTGERTQSFLSNIGSAVSMGGGGGGFGGF